jgi:GLPGLI family protein
MILLSKCNILDTCVMRVTYRVLFVNDTLKREKMKDVQLLQIGNKVTHCFSYSLYQRDSTLTKMDEKGATNFPNIIDEYVLPEEVITFFAKKQINVRYRTEFDMTNLCYAEAMPDIQWNLCDGQKDILGYNCQKAECRFRGRDYIAWYTVDIPLSSGPYKFRGLPGLILGISDAANDYNWECIGIQKEGNNDFVSQYKGKYMKEKTTTREGVRSIIKHLFKDPAGVLNLTKQQGVCIKNNDGKFYKALSGDFPPEPYNPIEKE